MSEEIEMIYWWKKFALVFCQDEFVHASNLRLKFLADWIASVLREDFP